MTIPKSNHGAAVTSAANQSFSDISTILSGFKYYFTYRGGDGNDYISIGGDSDDQIWGGGGDDFLWSGGGNDQLWGGTGNDILGVVTAMTSSGVRMVTIFCKGALARTD